MAVATAIILWLGRGMTFSGDELTWMLESPHLDLDGALQPHEGHLLLTTHVVYKLFFELFGVAYLPFRLLTVGTILLTSLLFFLYARRRVGPLVAGAPSLSLLLFGSDWLHVLFGNGFTVLFAAACGLGALLALDRGDRRGDALACALLCLGVVTYSVALAFLVGAAVSIVLAGGSRRRIWVAAVPAGLYLSWWLWSLGSGAGSGEQVSLLNALLMPAWAFQSLGAVASSLTGFDYRFSDVTSPASAGPALAVLALVGLGWGIRRGSVAPTLWPALGVVLGLWMLGALVSDQHMGRLPDDPRYLYPGAVAVLLVGVELGAGLRWSRTGLLCLYAVVFAGLAVNVMQLRDSATELREVNTVQIRAALSGLELVGRRAPAKFYPRPLPGVELSLLGEQSPLAVPFSALPEGTSVARAYASAAERYGGLALPVAELRAQGEPAGAQADAVLVAGLDLKLTAPHRGPTASCRQVDLTARPGATVPLAPGGAMLRSAAGPMEVQVRRFATSAAFGVGTLEPGRAAVLRIPSDRDSTPWRLSAAGPSITVCDLR
jgi:hypothetical protein